MGARMNRFEFKKFADTICEEMGKMLANDGGLFSLFTNSCQSGYTSLAEVDATYRSLYILKPYTSVKYHIGVKTNCAFYLPTKIVSVLMKDYLQELWRGKYISVNLDSAYDQRVVCLELIKQFTDYFFALSGIDLTTVDTLSLQNYESAKCKGTLLFLERCQAGIVNIGVNAARDIYFCPKHIKIIRKLMAGGNGLALAFVRQTSSDNPTRVFKFKGYANTNFNGLKIDILGPRIFDVYADKANLFYMSHLIPKLPNKKSEWRGQLDEIAQSFSISHPARFGRMQDVLDGIEKGGHGAAVLFADLSLRNPARDYMEDLVSKARGYSVSGVASYLQASMDGAIVIDINTGEIEYIGVILDGTAQCPGDLARGARHNSVATFCEYFNTAHGNNKFAAIVFSEDGGSTLYNI